MQQQETVSDPLYKFLSEDISENEFANIISREIREGTFCQAMKWVYPMALSYLKRRPVSSLCKDGAEQSGSSRANLLWQPTAFSDRQPDPIVLAIDIAAQSIELPHNKLAMDISKYVLHTVYEGGGFGEGLILSVANEHFADVHGWELDPIKKRIPSEDSEIVKYMEGKVGAPYVCEILDSARPGSYGKALSLIMPLADHIITCWEKHKHVLGRQGSANGAPVIKVRYFTESKEFRPWDVLHKHNKADANAILIALSSLNIASGFDAKPLRENLARYPISGVRIYLALNMLACMVPRANPNIIHGFKGYACSDFRKATESYLECNGHLPKPAKPRAPFRFSRRSEPTKRIW